MIGCGGPASFDSYNPVVLQSAFNKTRRDGYNVTPGESGHAERDAAVIPAKAGIHSTGVRWTPAFAGVTTLGGLTTRGGPEDAGLVWVLSSQISNIFG